MKVLVPFGTRPEIVKLAPVVAALRAAGASVHTIATGQHYDAALTDTFFRDLKLSPDARWSLPNGEGERLGAMLAAAHVTIGRTRPDAVVLLGDTHTVPIFALAGRQHRVPIVHVEAGLRSFNETSVEEVNRRVAAATASLHFAPTELAARMLHNEGVAAERVRVVGNPICDALRTSGVTRRPWQERRGAVVTAHRPTNVDDRGRLTTLCDVLAELARDFTPVTFPVHPRTAARLDEFGLGAGLRAAGVDLQPPVPYGAMLDLVAGAQLVVTDSGGLQEEAAWFGVPVVVLRHSTPRWEGVVAGASLLTGLEAGRVLDAVAQLSTEDARARIDALPCPYGDGYSAGRIADVLLAPETAGLLALREPDLAAPPALV
ncbi:MAG TPA: UDP-N-acetylglucosamine 2-epimerase (non-hydrolyzing) [Acidimicrobiales bacterium]|nr:UDP-N-acetylglucosamine 2-epimerase (non-hydrolyzing) [Acidimicrobiales bacterium]